jgi:uncharacterized membrane protein
MSGDYSDVLTDGVKSADELASLRRLVLVIYGLYAFSWVFGVTALIGVIVAHVKRDDARGSVYESHLTWQIRTFWWGLLWTALGFLTFVLVVGWFILAGVGIWLIYRLVKGWLYWNDRKPLAV